jgi:hypothetical protein
MEALPKSKAQTISFMVVPLRLLARILTDSARRFQQEKAARGARPAEVVSGQLSALSRRWVEFVVLKNCELAVPSQVLGSDV